MKNGYLKNEALVKKFTKMMCVIDALNSEEEKDFYRNALIESVERVEELMEKDQLQSECDL